ncbi:helix-turn-helix domain-containing protein [Paraclostridium sordellii]|uniref:helix-turn-helix domain-containing protein n=1 Tax=Paraclostridium sordellii TaxID=1505 RepID=UPI0003864D3A|nr:helix-turn-helix transcriptional regulator [Paeniclostridium sordellii]AUO31763.1 XRE family transcriptional regulator [Paeniclostridium sordellii]EPZ56212.1 helix-turn-helix family protein [[Clostridium] sordellii VPI 9048] [Paeniclostridium sordellii VPI 9048]CEK40109.1 dna-binding protein (plasmid) [[Clostridium] sordellii] [Paeniclostridium sordellii]
MNLQTIIKENRKKNNWSQDDLAKKLNISRQAVSKWETGESIPDIDKLIILSGIFSLTLDELIKGNTTEKTIVSEQQVIVKKESKKTIIDFLCSHWWLIITIVWYILLN